MDLPVELGCDPFLRMLSTSMGLEGDGGRGGLALRERSGKMSPSPPSLRFKNTKMWVIDQDAQLKSRKDKGITL